MAVNSLVEQFCESAEKAGAEVRKGNLEDAVSYIKSRCGGTVLVPSFPSGKRAGLAERLSDAGCRVERDDFRRSAPQAAAGVTGANFGLAATGTVVLESTEEAIRLATTLPERHFVILDPNKIISDEQAAVPAMRALHGLRPRNFVAYITGPSRTADIERVLTIGVHGPRELHIFLVEGLSDDFMEL
ncbi:lactate utilization protein [Desulfuromonas sp. TF]|uniref:LutC/YkgG family protein n=1 Tax=Desulfuromonas sp. TF TaxID=1232410 RepID=UPI0004133FE4|nr:lactate utilization protein [Desulfuromonas sp. TF]